MRCRGAVIVGLCAVTSTMLAGGLLMPASAASPVVDTSFSAVTTTETTNDPFGPFLMAWSFSTVTIGPSPTGSSLTITYGIYEGSGCQSEFALDDHHGDTLAGHVGGCSNDMVGQITAATGQYEPDLNKTATLTLQVTPDQGVALDYTSSDSESGVFPIAGSLHLH